MSVHPVVFALTIGLMAGIISYMDQKTHARIADLEARVTALEHKE